MSERLSVRARDRKSSRFPGIASGWAKLREIEDRGSRGEYIPSFSKIAICVGSGDLVGIRSSLAEVISAATSPVPIRVICGKYLEAYRSDPEIKRLHLELFGW